MILLQDDFVNKKCSLCGRKKNVTVNNYGQTVFGAARTGILWIRGL